MPPRIIEQGLLGEILQNIFSTMVHLPLEPAPESSPERDAPLVSGIMSIVGPRRYILVLQTTERLACLLGGAILSETMEAWSAMTADAFGELVNMTAGSLKPHLGEGFSLSLPTVVYGRDWEYKIPKMTVLHREFFRCQGHVLEVYLGDDGGG